MNNVQDGPFPLNYQGYVAARAWLNLHRYGVGVIQLEKELVSLESQDNYGFVVRVNTYFNEQQQRLKENKGLFFVLEGIDCSGKSTQHKLLVERLQRTERTVVATREAGGTPEAEKIRDFIFGGGDDRLPTTDMLLMMAARNEHIHNRILPTLRAGNIIVSDRFMLSTVALQGASGVSKDLINNIHHLLFEDITPDLTIILDMDPEHSQQRQVTRQKSDYMDFRDLIYHKLVRENYIQYALDNIHNNKVCMVEASGSIEDVHERIWEMIIERFPFLGE